MSACPDEGTLLGHLDGQLAEQDEAVRQHLLDCAPCQVVLERLRSITTEVDVFLDVLGEGVDKPVIVPANTHGRARRTWAVPIAAAAASLFLIVQVRHSGAEPRVNAFLPLDENGPIQIGTVVKVKLPASLFDPTGTAADSAMVDSEVILGDDGAPRAVRLLKESKENK